MLPLSSGETLLSLESCVQVCPNAEALKGVRNNPESTPPLSKYPRGCPHVCGRVAFRAITGQGESWRPTCPTPFQDSSPRSLGCLTGPPCRPPPAEDCPSPPPPPPSVAWCVSISAFSEVSGGTSVRVAGGWRPRQGSSGGQLPCCCSHTSSFVRELRAEVLVLTPRSVQRPPLPARGRLSATQGRWARGLRREREGIFAKNRRETIFGFFLASFCLEILFQSLVSQGSQNFM